MNRKQDPQSDPATPSSQAAEAADSTDATPSDAPVSDTPAAPALPTTGRVVLFRVDDGPKVPAIVVSSSPGFDVPRVLTVGINDEDKARVTKVPPHVNLVAFDSRGSTYYERVVEGEAPGQFSWPKRG